MGQAHEKDKLKQEKVLARKGFTKYVTLNKLQSTFLKRKINKMLPHSAVRSKLIVHKISI